VVKVGDHVLPISVTSGVFFASGSWFVSFVRASVQSCCWIFSVPPVACFYWSTRY